MYSIKLCNDIEKKRAKGIKSSVVKHDINHENYNNLVESGIKEYSLMNAIISKLHSLYTYTLNKVGLYAFDDIRYILDNGKDTIAHGHNLIKIDNYTISPTISDRNKK